MISIYKKIGLLSVFALISIQFTNAQVKVGSNPTMIGSNNNLEVEASTTGRKLSVDKTTGKVTIADGTQGLDKVLTSDANGVASWVAGSKLSLVKGVLPGNGGWPAVNSMGIMIYSGANITLPPGKWLVFWRATYINQTNNTAQLWWDLTTSASGYIAADASVVGRGLSGMATPGWFAPSTIIYNVTATTNTTYYIWVGDLGNAAFTNGSLVYSGEGDLFAIPIN